MTTHLSAAQQAQINNRDDGGKWQQKTHGEPEDTTSTLGIGENPGADPEQVSNLMGALHTGRVSETMNLEVYGLAEPVAAGDLSEGEAISPSDTQQRKIFGVSEDECDYIRITSVAPGAAGNFTTEPDECVTVSGMAINSQGSTRRIEDAVLTRHSQIARLNPGVEEAYAEAVTGKRESDSHLDELIEMAHDQDPAFGADTQRYEQDHLVKQIDNQFPDDPNARAVIRLCSDRAAEERAESTRDGRVDPAVHARTKSAMGRVFHAIRSGSYSDADETWFEARTAYS